MWLRWVWTDISTQWNSTWGWTGVSCNITSPTTIWVGNIPAWTDLTWMSSCDILSMMLVASVNPSIDIRWTSFVFWLYEVWQVLATPLIEWRWHLWWWPVGVLTSLDIAPIGFTQANPTPNTRYWANDANVTITLWTTRTYTATIHDDQWRTGSASGSYTGTFPYYWTSVNITTLTKQALAGIGSTYFPINMVAETGGDKYKADFETANIVITWIEFYNTVSGNREWMWGSKANSLTLRTTSAVTHTVQGNVVNYTRYTHNWVDGWALQTRFYTN